MVIDFQSNFTGRRLSDRNLCFKKICSNISESARMTERQSKDLQYETFPRNCVLNRKLSDCFNRPHVSFKVCYVYELRIYCKFYWNDCSNNSTIFFFCYFFTILKLQTACIFFSLKLLYLIDCELDILI